MGLHIVIAEPRPTVCATFHHYLSCIPEVEQVYEVTTLQEMERHCSAHAIDFIFLSQALLDRVSPLSSQCFLLLTKHLVNVETLFTMYRKGIQGYVRPDLEAEEFRLAFPLMLLKQTHVFFLDPTTTPLLKGEELNIMTRAKLAMLSERELEVLYLRNERMNNADIAQQLFVTEVTVRTHIMHICEKLGVSNEQLPTLHLPERPPHPHHTPEQKK